MKGIVTQFEETTVTADVSRKAPTDDPVMPIDIDICISDPRELQLMYKGVESATMEEKWDIEFSPLLPGTEKEGSLTFYRSWTKTPIYVARCDESGIHSCNVFTNNVKGDVDHVSKFQQVVYHVLLARPVEEPFVFGEPATMERWSWLGIAATQ